MEDDKIANEKEKKKNDCKEGYLGWKLLGEYIELRIAYEIWLLGWVHEACKSEAQDKESRNNMKSMS